MPLRVKNIAVGFVDATGFHPVRRSPDYDAERAGDDYGSARDSSGVKYMMRTRRGAAPAGRRIRVKPHGWTTGTAKPHRKRKAPAKRRAPARARKSNPISTQWTTARVRRTGAGDVQVMLFPKRVAVNRRNPSGRYSIKTQYTTFAVASTNTEARAELARVKIQHPGKRLYIYDNETGNRVSLRRLPRSRTPSTTRRRR